MHNDSFSEGQHVAKKHRKFCRCDLLWHLLQVDFHSVKVISTILKDNLCSNNLIPLFTYLLVSNFRKSCFKPSFLRVFLTQVCFPSVTLNKLTSSQ